MSNTKWYEDENLVNLSRKCDEVYFDQDEEGMCILVDECYRQAHDLKNTNMIRARYFYISFTIQSLSLIHILSIILMCLRALPGSFCSSA